MTLDFYQIIDTGIERTSSRPVGRSLSLCRRHEVDARSPMWALAVGNWTSTVGVLTCDMMSVMTPPDEGKSLDIATLSPNGCKARFGVAFFRAVCSQAGVGFSETSIDEDVLAIDGRVEFALADVRVQIKCSGRFKINGGDTATWPAEGHWWAKWHGSKVPVYFVLVVVDPDDQSGWLEHRDDGTLHRAAAYWVRVDQMSEASGITVPKSQRLGADTLRSWAVDLEEGYELRQGGVDDAS